MANTTLSRSLTFTVEEAAKIAQWRPQSLRNWITAGRLTPAYPGLPAKGKGHRFAPQQLLGMAAVSAMAAKKWTCTHHAQEILKGFSEMSDQALLDWLGMGDAAGHTEEAGAVFAHHSIFANKDLPSTPEFEAVAAEVNKRMIFAEEAIRRRLRGQRDRFAKR
jgi:hypothetical protein